ncbi:helix-turn-helix domain-containing protein [Micromonospora tulbaghiae]|uniref:helix-turn-helix domain-containing protein n=1 Tax=Micromonospora tulbaghiae TaxID=479978 RepID=UPI0013C4B38B|nr:helix-turn-helix transcriptional regulator [Micromonospora tulbaghiae]
MVPNLEARKAAFARWVQRQLDRAKEQRGWSVPKIAEVAGIGNPTIYRWRDGNWRKGPQAEQIVAFCNALGLSPSIPFGILWPGQDEMMPADEEPPLHPDLRIIQRRLADPNVGEAEKATIHATLRYLADLADRTGPGRGRRAAS